MTDRILPGMDLAYYCRRHRVRFVRKDRSRLMRLIALVIPGFLSRFWTTIGRTVYYPTDGPAQEPGAVEMVITFGEGMRPEGVHDALTHYLEQHRATVEHELIHVQQFRRLWHLHSALYLLGMPLPFFFAWYRWRSEREAYLHELRHYAPRVIGGNTKPERGEAPWLHHIGRVVNTLWRVYGWTWPKPLMRRWFRRRLAGEIERSRQLASGELPKRQPSIHVPGLGGVDLVQGEPRRETKAEREALAKWLGRTLGGRS